MNIRLHIRNAIEDGLPAHFDVQGAVPGVVFHDEWEFIPFHDLGYNQEIGYFRMSRFPDEPSECTNEATDFIHPYDTDDELEMFVWVDDGGTAHHLGERWQVADLAQALLHFLRTGETEEEVIGSNHPIWGGPLDIGQACELAHEYDPGSYPNDLNLRFRIRRAAREGFLPGARQTRSGRWRIPQDDLFDWLKDESAHRPGKNPGEGENRGNS